MRKIAVATAMSGKTASVASASRQSRKKRIDGRADEHQRVLDEARDAVGDELVERLDVVREPADDHAGAVALVEAEREPLQVAEELVAQVGEDPLARPAGEVRLRVARDPVRAAPAATKTTTTSTSRAVVVRADAVVDRELREVAAARAR